MEIGRKSAAVCHRAGCVWQACYLDHLPCLRCALKGPTRVEESGQESDSWTWHVFPLSCSPPIQSSSRGRLDGLEGGLEEVDGVWEVKSSLCFVGIT